MGCGASGQRRRPARARYAADRAGHSHQQHCGAGGLLRRPTPGRHGEPSPCLAHVERRDAAQHGLSRGSGSSRPRPRASRFRRPRACRQCLTSAPFPVTRTWSALPARPGRLRRERVGLLQPARWHRDGGPVDGGSLRVRAVPGCGDGRIGHRVHDRPHQGVRHLVTSVTGDLWLAALDPPCSAKSHPCSSTRARVL